MKEKRAFWVWNKFYLGVTPILVSLTNNQAHSFSGKVFLCPTWHPLKNRCSFSYSTFKIVWCISRSHSVHHFYFILFYLKKKCLAIFSKFQDLYWERVKVTTDPSLLSYCFYVCQANAEHCGEKTDNVKYKTAGYFCYERKSQLSNVSIFLRNEKNIYLLPL